MKLRLSHIPIPITVLIILILTAMSLYADHSHKADILIIHSYHQSMPWTDSINKGMLEFFGQNENYNINIEYLDARRYGYPGYEDDQEAYLRRKYVNQANIPDIIISSDDAALNFLLAKRDALFPDVPVFFCGVNDYRPERTAGKTFYTGVNEAPDFKGTLEVAMRMKPHYKDILVVTDQSFTGQENLNRLQEAADSLKINDRITIMDNWTIEELQEKFLYLTEQDIIMLIHINPKTRDGQTLSTFETVKIYHDYAKSPVFTCWEYVLLPIGGIVGGHVISGYAQGQTVAEMADSYLQGIPFADLPVINESPNVFLFDSRELGKFQISKKDLPDDSILLNRVLTVYEQYKNTVWLASAIIILLIITIALLIVYIIYRKRSQSDLERESGLLERAMRAGNLILWEYDIATQTISLLGPTANYAERGLLSLEDFMGLLHPEDRPAARKILLNGFDSVDDFSFEYRYKDSDGSWHWQLLKGSVIERRSLNNEAIRLCGTQIDVTERKLTEIRLKENNHLLQEQYARINELNERLIVIAEQAKEADRMKTAFLANVSHEIRTPLNGILGFTELLESGESDQENRKSFLKIIKDSGEHLLAVISDIIDVAKSDSDSIKLNYAMIYPAEIIRELTTFYGESQLLKSRNLKIKYEIPEEMQDLELRTDPDRLKQVLVNLIDNALKFTDKGSIEIRYRLNADKNHLFTVMDTGKGISPENIKRIFERFYQVENSDPQTPQGTGLGLSICQAIVQRMGGEIWVESEKGHGSTFYFTIPDQTQKNE